MKKLAHFLLRDVISDGPAGTVYKAEEVLPGDNRRVVALKVLPGIPDGVVTGNTPEEQRFFAEVRVLAQLAVHPHVVTIYGMGLTDGLPWLAMEYSPATLASRMGETPAEPAQVLRLLRQVASGLSAMHGLKPALIHQDLKPSNILLDRVGNYKITDFSLATVTSANKTHGLATVRYAAPEMLSNEFGRVGPATDLYALGHIAYELATGQRGHREQFRAVFEGNAGKEPPPNKWMMWHVSMNMHPAALATVIRGFPERLSEVIARLMTKPISGRYVSADELLSDLSSLRGGASAPASSTPAAAPAASPPAAARPTVVVPMPLSSPKAAAKTVPLGVPEAPAVPAAASGTTRYWVRLRGNVTGPFDLATLQRQIKQGQISRLHQVSTDQATWKPATAIEGLYGPTIV